MMGDVTFVTGVAVVEMTRVRHCIMRYVLARAVRYGIDIVNDLPWKLLVPPGI